MDKFNLFLAFNFLLFVCMYVWPKTEVQILPMATGMGIGDIQLEVEHQKEQTILVVLQIDQHK
jgi:hypothetical protein